MFIVSANYRDRSSPYRWLIREDHEPPEAARACRTVTLENARFGKSDQYEEGFGCRVVARAEKALGRDFEITVNRLHFDGTQDFLDESGQRVTDRRFRTMLLAADGQIQAVYDDA